MGSTVLAYPAVMEIKRRIPRAQIFFLVFDENRPILEALDVTPRENVVSLRSAGLAALLWDGCRAVWRLRKAKIDATVDMDFFSRFAAALAFLVCRGPRAGFHRFTLEGLGRGDLLTHRVTYSAHVHTSIAFLALVRSLLEGQEMVPFYKGEISLGPGDIPSYSPSPELIDAVRRKIESTGLKREAGHPRLILLNPNSSGIFPLRKWPLRYFAELAAMLLRAAPEAGVIITGSAAETADASFILHAVRHARCVSLAGQTSFPELLALYSIADLLVTNDSGPAHFASLLKLPTLALFGPETPQLYKPLGDACKCLYADFACSPCVSVFNNKKSPCVDNRCLQALVPKKVLEEAMLILDKK
jgi:ADP-heptose:LPS heptosyltransferase